MSDESRVNLKAWKHSTQQRMIEKRTGLIEAAFVKLELIYLERWNKCIESEPKTPSNTSTTSTK